jgi:hypothetical protein
MEGAEGCEDAGVVSHGKKESLASEMAARPRSRGCRTSEKSKCAQIRACCRGRRRRNQLRQSGSAHRTGLATPGRRWTMATSDSNQKKQNIQAMN